MSIKSVLPPVKQIDVTIVSKVSSHIKPQKGLQVSHFRKNVVNLIRAIVYAVPERFSLPEDNSSLFWTGGFVIE